MSERRVRSRFRLGGAGVALLLAGSGPGFGQDVEAGPSLGLELNSASESENACRLTFLVSNELGIDVASLVLEIVVFKASGGLDRLTLFDFQEIPAGRPRVRQFDVSDVPCGDIGSVLVNGVDACDGAGLDTSSCLDALTLSSRTGIDMLG
ncbi:MAG: hypothetical protein AAF871_11345 [Pseudomonadota bacterium]